MISWRIIIHISRLFLLLLLVSTTLKASNSYCQFEPLSTNVYVIKGSNESTCPSKPLLHPVTNPVAILTNQGVILVDPGSSQQVGQLVINRLKLITQKPVIAIINTHIHGLYWLANHSVKTAFPQVQIYAHEKIIQRIYNGEGLYWVEAITGQFSGEKTHIAAPTQPIKHTQIINIDGINLKIHVLGTAHTDHDLLIEVISDQILMLGGLVVEPEVPSQGVPQDANFKKQIEATKYAINLNIKLIFLVKAYLKIDNYRKEHCGFYKCFIAP